MSSGKLFQTAGAACWDVAVGRAWAVCLQYTAWRPVLCPTPDSTERSIACPPSWRGHSRFWCYSDRCGAHDDDDDDAQICKARPK